MKDHKNRGKKTYKKASKGGETQPVVVVNDKFAHIEAVQAIPLEVKVYGNNFDKALRAFRALVQKERILSSYKEKQSYEKPSDKRRRKRNESKRKLLEVGTKKDHDRHDRPGRKSRRSNASSE
jgi:small subunit ribosomal protein S21